MTYALWPAGAPGMSRRPSSRERNARASDRGNVGRSVGDIGPAIAHEGIPGAAAVLSGGAHIPRAPSRHRGRGAGCCDGANAGRGRCDRGHALLPPVEARPRLRGAHRQGLVGRARPLSPRTASASFRATIPSGLTCRCPGMPRSSARCFTSHAAWIERPPLTHALIRSLAPGCNGRAPGVEKTCAAVAHMRYFVALML